MQSPDSPPKLPLREYIRPNISRLEVVREVIAEARHRRWPYRQIVEFLGVDYQITISVPNLRLFCIRRGIEKGVGETQKKETVKPPPVGNTNLAALMDTVTPKPRRKRKGAKFVFRDGPMKTRENGLIKD